MNKWWRNFVGVLIITLFIGIIGLGFVSKVLVNSTEIISCNKQMDDWGGLSGIVSSPAKLKGMKEITTLGCPYNFKKDDTRPDLITFDLIVFDRRGFPYVYEMKIDELLIVCQTSPMECRGESTSEYIDFPEGKVVVLGIVNSEIPNKEIDEQPDLEYLAKLESALEKGNWYPLQLSKQRIQVWSLSY